MSKEIKINNNEAKLTDKVHKDDLVFIPTPEEKAIICQVTVMLKCFMKIMILQLLRNLKVSKPILMT